MNPDEFLAWFEWLKGSGRILTWVAVFLLIILGLVGTIVPFLPGNTLILAGCCLHFFAMGQEKSGLTWLALIIIAVLYVASLVVDNLSGAIGAKWFGSSKWGIVGAILGGIVGLFFGLPGIFIGPIVGVFVFEWVIGRKKIKDAGNSTVGTVVGGATGMVLSAMIGLLMITCYVVDTFFWN